MLLSEAIQILKENNYTVELNEGKFSRTLGVLALAISSITHASTPVSIDELNSDRYIKLSDEEVPSELEYEKKYGEDFYYDTESNEYVLYDEINNEAIGYDSTFSIETITKYNDSTGKIISNEFNNSTIYTHIPDTLKAAIDSINNVLDFNLSYKEGFMERGKPVTLYIFDKKNNRIEYIENGKFKYGIMMPENENDSYTFFRYDKNEKVNLEISFYTNYDWETKDVNMKQIRVVTDLVHKTEVEYYTDGKLKIEAKLDNNGDLHGTEISYYPSVKKAGIRQYSHGKQIGYTKCTDGRIGNSRLQCQIDEEE